MYQEREESEMKIITTTKFLFEAPDFEIIKKQLKEKGLTITCLSKEIGISRGTFYDMLNGKTYASPRALIVLHTYGFLLPLNLRGIDYQ